MNVDYAFKKKKPRTTRDEFMMALGPPREKRMSEKEYVERENDGVRGRETRRNGERESE